MHTNYYKLRFLFVLLITFCSAVRIYAQGACPANMEVCINRAPFALTGAAVPGGTYSGGPGVSNGIFSPSVAGEGTHTITYVYDEGNVQGKVCTFTIRVYTTVQITYFLVETTACLSALPIKLPANVGITPDADVTVTGTGVSNNYFYPSVAGEGNHTYSFTATDPYGCSGVGSSNVSVYAGNAPTVTCPADKTVNSTVDPAFLLTGASSSSSNGYYSGQGVNTSSGIFDPSVAGNGMHEITYTSHADDLLVNNCRSACQFTVTVGVLPVTLTQFTASAKENNIRLDWKTTAESKFDRFEIEKSFDARKDFVKIHQIGGSDAANSYSFIDQNAEKGIPVYYRLKMVDKDGSYAYSKVTWALVETKGNLYVYPNPASREIRIGSSLEMTEAKLINMSGSEIFSEKYSPAKNKVVTLPKLPGGIYLLQVKNAAGISAFSKVIIN